MGKKTIEDCCVEGKRVLLRVDFNVPRDKDTGEITNDERIRAALPTIKYLIANHAKVIIMSHLGRPKGKVIEDLRLTCVVERLSSLLGQKVTLASDCVGQEVHKDIEKMNNGDVLLLENVRFHSAEEKNDLSFSKLLAQNGDMFVNDAFGTAHRAHCSTEGVGHYLPSYAGYLIKNEISALARACIRPVSPVVAIVGGAKISDKIGVIESLLNIADVLIIGGGMANTFLAAQGHHMQASLVELEKIELAHDILQKAKKIGKKFLIPVDVVVSDSLNNQKDAHVVLVDKLQEGDMALDIGPLTGQLYQDALKDAQTVFWNGPMGVFEIAAFAEGTNTVAKAVANCNGYTIVGGGDSVAAIEKAKLSDQIDHISTGGGASLAFIEGRILPGLAVIGEREESKA